MSRQRGILKTKEDTHAGLKRTHTRLEEDIHAGLTKKHTTAISMPREQLADTHADLARKHTARIPRLAAGEETIAKQVEMLEAEKKRAHTSLRNTGLYAETNGLDATAQHSLTTVRFFSIFSLTPGPSAEPSASSSPSPSNQQSPPILVNTLNLLLCTDVFPQHQRPHVQEQHQQRASLKFEYADYNCLSLTYDPSLSSAF